MVYFSAGFLFILFLFFILYQPIYLFRPKSELFTDIAGRPWYFSVFRAARNSRVSVPTVQYEINSKTRTLNAFFSMFKLEYIEFLPSKKVDRIAYFPTIKNIRCLISFPGFFFLLEFMFMAFFFFFPLLLTWKMNHKKSIQLFHKFFQMLGIRETDNQPVTTDN